MLSELGHQVQNHVCKTQKTVSSGLTGITYYLCLVSKVLITVKIIAAAYLMFFICMA